MNKIPMSECIKGRVYKINCRNLPYGVYDGSEGFIGIREKFGSFYLFTEYHYDHGAPFGTVSGHADLGIDIPVDIQIKEHLDTYDIITNRHVEYVNGISNPLGITNVPGWWVYVDTKESCPKEVKPTAAENKALFDFLKQVEVDRDGDVRWKRIRER